MIWLIAIATGWALVAVLLGLLIGNGIRIERGEERPARAEATPQPSAPTARAAVQVTMAGADPAGEVATAAAR